MTTIAWDGESLCSDSQATAADLVVSLSAVKVHRLDDGGMMALCGEPAFTRAMLDWLNGKRPAAPTGNFAAIVVREGSVRCYDDGESYLTVEAPYARGSGCVVARVAMLCGRTAAEAVAMAAELDIYSGGPVQSMRLMAPETPGPR